jgi:uncharacterized protein
MKVTQHKPGTPCWVDVASPNIETTTRFYTNLFGWTAGEPTPEAGGYTMLFKGDAPVAAIGPIMGEGQPSAWSWYVAVNDADDIAHRVESAGGKVLVAPMDVLDAGRMAVFLDPSGTPFAIWQPGTMPGAGMIREPGSLSWVELMTRSPESAAEFYPRVFGWQVKETTEPMPYTQFGLDDDFFAGMMRMSGEQWPADLPDHWMVYFEVEDPDATCERIQSLGGTVSVPPTDIPGVGRFAVVGDSTGAFFSIVHTTME